MLKCLLINPVMIDERIFMNFQKKLKRVQIKKQTNIN